MKGVLTLILTILMLAHVSINIISIKTKTYKTKKVLDIILIILGGAILLTKMILQDGFLMFLCWVFIFAINIKTYQLHKESEQLEHCIKAVEKEIAQTEHCIKVTKKVFDEIEVSDSEQKGEE